MCVCVCVLMLLYLFIRWVLHFNFLVSAVRGAGENGNSVDSGGSEDNTSSGIALEAAGSGTTQGDDAGAGRGGMLALTGPIEDFGWGLPLLVLRRTPQPQPLARAIRIEY